MRHLLTMTQHFFKHFNDTNHFDGKDRVQTRETERKKKSYYFAC